MFKTIAAALLVSNVSAVMTTAQLHAYLEETNTEVTW